MKKDAGVTGGKVVKGTFAMIGRFIATFFMVGIITGCMVACVLTVYVFSMVGSEEPLNLDEVELGYTSAILYQDKQTGEWVETQKLYITDNNRIWVNSDQISNWVKLAVISIEDKRFAETEVTSQGLVLTGGHHGVDWRRTAGAGLAMFGFGDATGGGSTITQQLIKNVTEDDDIRVDRKVREIFRALELEKQYSKERILEAYLNVVPFGAGTNGIETASLTYFGKHANELTLAEAAAVVGITKAPTYYSPFLNPDNNKDRQEDILFFMHEQGRITDAEYEEALEAPLVFKREEYQAQVGNIMTYFDDHVINTVLNDLQEQKGWTYQYAYDQLYRGGYQIYATGDLEMQEYLENFYLNVENFPPVANATYPQSACNIITPDGRMLATVGHIGEKEGNLMFNRATMATRHPGSSIKPLGAYALAFEYDRVNWSTIIEDSAINIAAEGQPPRMWPTNYYAGYYGPITVQYAVAKSVNTVPVKLVQALTPQAVFDFMHDRLNMYNLVAANSSGYSDIGPAPMALGALTKGVTPLEMAGAYQIFANGGSFTTPYCYEKVVDSNGRTILEADTTKVRALSEDTAVLMNKVLQTVTTEGTGTAASMGGAMPTAGKTGTSEHDVNQWFIGMTPYYVCQVWMGYDDETRVNEYGVTVPNGIRYYNYGPPILWKSIMAPLHEGLDYKQFPESEGVVSKEYCTVTGLLATSNCSSVKSGWYKSSRLPSSCPGHASARKDSDRDSSDSDEDDDDSGTKPVRVQALDRDEE